MSTARLPPPVFALRTMISTSACSLRVMAWTAKPSDTFAATALRTLRRSRRQLCCATLKRGAQRNEGEPATGPPSVTDVSRQDCVQSAAVRDRKLHFMTPACRWCFERKNALSGIVFSCATQGEQHENDNDEVGNESSRSGRDRPSSGDAVVRAVAL